jgi:predicted phosphodiesterase
MRVIDRHIPYASRSDTFKIIATSCWHVGNRHCREDAIRRMVKQIANEDKTYFIALGDMCDYISIGDIKRREFSEMALWLFENGGEGLNDIARAENVVLGTYLKPIAHKCIGLCEGNHEDSICKYSEHDAYAAQVEMLADGANDHKLEHRGIVNLRFRRSGGTIWTYTIAATHGSGSGEAPGSPDNRLAAMVGQYDGIDLLLMGHWHTFGQSPITRFRPSARGLTEQKTVWGLSVPSLCADMKYAEKRDKRPLVMGYWEILITPDKEKVDVSFKQV